LGAQHGKIDADLRTFALLGTPSVQSVHDYYPFALEDGGRLAPMAAELVDRLAVLVAACRFHGMVVADSRSLRCNRYVRMQHLVRRTNYVPSWRFWGDVRREFMKRFSPALHGTFGSYLRDALHEGSADAVACLPVPRAQVFSSFLLFAWWLMLLFLIITSHLSRMMAKFI
jgi:nicotinamidase-related amidase